MNRAMTPKTRKIIHSMKRTFWYGCYPDDTEHTTASYWDGGSKSVYTVYNMQTGARHTPPTGVYPMFVANYVLKPYEVLVVTGVFQGKPSTPAIRVRESDSAMFEEHIK
jgi:hypothetical protein